MEDQSLVTNLRVNISNKGGSQRSQKLRTVFLTTLPVNQKQKFFTFDSIKLGRHCRTVSRKDLRLMWSHIDTI